MLIETASLSANAVYHWLVQTVVPRPIAWLLTDNGYGEGLARYNLAPFSWFNAVASEPPLLMVSFINKPDGSLKDTLENVLQREHAVLHIATKEQAAALVDSSVPLPHGQSELLRQPYQLIYEKHTEGTEKWHNPLPRIKGVPVAFYCCKHSTLKIENSNTTLVFLQVDAIYIEENVLKTDAKGRTVIDAQKFEALARLGGDALTWVQSVFELARPKI